MAKTENKVVVVSREKTLSELQRRAASLLARGLTQREVGRLVGRDERTIRTWLTTIPQFCVAIENQRRRGGLTPTAVLNELLYSDSESIRLRAATALLNTPADADHDHVCKPVLIYAGPANPS